MLLYKFSLQEFYYIIIIDVVAIYFKCLLNGLVQSSAQPEFLQVKKRQTDAHTVFIIFTDNFLISLSRLFYG